MINFIVCEDNKIILQKNIDIINKTMFKNNINYRIYKFTNNEKQLQNLIKEDIGIKIYILDIELENISGIDIARNIRKTDNKSIIIISTTYVEYLPFALKNKLMLFDFVSKFEDYENNLSKVINNAIKQLKEQNLLV
ncbi:MAG: response regulator [Bacilli bacterium]|nr:response regulator [Bacilli bacterium]